MREIHTRLLSDIASEYLTDKNLQRFRALAKRFLTTPADWRLRDPNDIIEALERKGHLAVGKYNKLLEIVKDIDVQIVEKINKANAEIDMERGKFSITSL